MIRRLAALVPAFVLASGLAHAGDGKPVLIVKMKDKIGAGEVPRVQVIASGSDATSVSWVEVEVNDTSAWRLGLTNVDSTGVTTVALAGAPGSTTYLATVSVTGSSGESLWAGSGKVTLDGAQGTLSGAPVGGSDLAVTSVRAFPTSDPALFDLALTLVGRDVPKAAASTLSLSGGDGKTAPLEKEVEVILGDPRVHFTADATLEGYPGDSTVDVEVRAYSAAGKNLDKSRQTFVLTQMVGPDGLPGGVELLPASGRESLPRGDILIGGEPIDIE